MSTLLSVLHVEITSANNYYYDS